MGDNTLGGIFRDLGHSLSDFFGGGKLDPDHVLGIEVLFGMLGYLAKLDSLVTSHEADYINGMMDSLKLSMKEREIAAHALQRGRNREFELADEFARYRSVFKHGSPEVERLYDGLVRLAAADERLRPKERQFLETATIELGYAPEELNRRLASLALAR